MAQVLIDLTTRKLGSPPPTPVNRGFYTVPLRLKDIYLSGRGRIYGTVANKGAPNFPVRRRLLLLRDFDGICVGETWSDATSGSYEFRFIDETLRYTVAAYDHTQSLRIVLADNLTPELM